MRSAPRTQGDFFDETVYGQLLPPCNEVIVRQTNADNMKKEFKEWAKNPETAPDWAKQEK